MPIAADRSPLLMLLITGLALAPVLGACEPIIPMFQVLGGPGALAQSLVVLLIAVLVKAALYAWFLRRTAPGQAFVLMVAGNVVSTVVSVFAAAMVAGFLLVGLVGIALCAVVPARRLATAFPKIDQRASTFGIVLLMTGLVFVSMILWSLSRQVLDGRESLVLYWMFKIGFVFISLAISLFITVFWEEWTIWRLRGSVDVDPAQIQPIVAANVITLGLVALYAAAVILPRRLASSNFLVDLLRSVFAA